MIKPNPPILRLDQLDIPVPFLVLAFCVAYIQGILLNNPPQSLMYAQLGGSHLAMLVPPFTAGYSSGELTRLISAFRPVRFRHLLLKS